MVYICSCPHHHFKSRNDFVACSAISCGTKQPEINKKFSYWNKFINVMYRTVVDPFYSYFLFPYYNQYYSFRFKLYLAYEYVQTTFFNETGLHDLLSKSLLFSLRQHFYYYGYLCRTLCSQFQVLWQSSTCFITFFEYECILLNQ